MSPRLDRLPEPVHQAIIGFYSSQTNATSEVSIFSGDHAKTMLKAYVLANELVNHIQIISTLIDELRRYGPEGYVPRTRKEVDQGTLKPVPKKKSPPKTGKATHYCVKDVRDPNGIMSGCLNKAKAGSEYCGVHQPKTKPAEESFVAGWTKVIRDPANATIRANLAKARKKRDAVARDIFLIDQGDDE